MLVIGIVSTVLGVILVLIAGLILLPKIFITDGELDLLTEIPIEQSTSHMTGAVSGATLPVAVTDVSKLLEYRESYINARKEEREKGKRGLYCLVTGTIFQVFGAILAGLST